MSSLLLLLSCLFLFPQFTYEKPYPFGSGIGKRMLIAKIQIVPDPFLIIRMTRRRNGPFDENGLI